MESFFFNITKSRYKKTSLGKNSYRIDISNGVVFFDLFGDESFEIKSLDRMCFIIMTKGETKVSVEDRYTGKRHDFSSAKVATFLSTRQDLLFKTSSSKERVFILFIADFFLKRYLSQNPKEPVDFLYKLLQDELTLKLINTQPTDALSSYIVEKLLMIDENSHIHSLKAQLRIFEFMIHVFSYLDIFDDKLSKDEIEIALRAKEQLLKNFITPPTISELAHICATNESKLKKIFKKIFKEVYGITIYKYIQRLKLDHANLLLTQERLSVKEIAKRVGYSHQGHFSKLFYEHFGVLPKELK